MLVSQMCYTAIVQTSFGVFKCKQLADGSEALRLAPHLDCGAQETQKARMVASASLAIWGVAFPIFFGWLLRATRGRPGFSFSLVSYGYRPDCIHWEAWECLKRFFILLAITLCKAESAAFILLHMFFFSSVMMAKSEPFESALVNTAHLGAESVLFVFLLVGLMSTLDPSDSLQLWNPLSMLGLVSLLSMAVFLAFILVIELGSILAPGSTLHRVWTKFLNDSTVVSAPVIRMMRRASGMYTPPRAGQVTPEAYNIVIPVPADAGALTSISPGSTRNLETRMRSHLVADNVGCGTSAGAASSPSAAAE